MNKRGLIISLLSALSLSLFACGSDSDNDNDSACKELKCDQIVGDGYSHVCAVISGKAECKNACLGKANGKNAAVCFSNHSLPPESRPVFSSVDTCAKDDNGVLYSVSVVDTKCDNGCNEETGLCNKSQVSCDLNCVVMDKREEACFVIDGTPTCKETCLADKEGENGPLCYMESGFAPSYEPDSVIDTCKKDDNGKLYSTGTRIIDECNNGCNEETGLCN